MLDDSNSTKSKRSSKTTTESSNSNSNYSSIFNFDESRFSGLSDRMRFALRGSSGSTTTSATTTTTNKHHADPLEQWMAKHSGGTLRDAHVVGDKD
ncbi:hypothetical protein GGS20DRAFT_573622 [Poronia punctata]|nr:hypothetical protein GGS20DRAFT_573622 [Poronia punctata]